MFKTMTKKVVMVVAMTAITASVVSACDWYDVWCWITEALVAAAG